MTEWLLIATLISFTPNSSTPPNTSVTSIIVPDETSCEKAATAFKAANTYTRPNTFILKGISVNPSTVCVEVTKAKNHK